ncbi:hypothetical protein WJX82_008567 [Trebouxia sp. C0006]
MHCRIVCWIHCSNEQQGKVCVARYIEHVARVDTEVEPEKQVRCVLGVMEQEHTRLSLGVGVAGLALLAAHQTILLQSYPLAVQPPSSGAWGVWLLHTLGRLLTLVLGQTGWLAPLCYRPAGTHQRALSAYPLRQGSQ